MKRTLFSTGCMVAFGSGLVLSLAVPGAAFGFGSPAVISGLTKPAAVSKLVTPVAEKGTKEKKNPNDRTVRVIMGWAFAAVPETIRRDGKDVKLNRSNPKDFYIPVEDARRVIRVAMRSANAEVCDLTDLQINNFRKMMANEKALGKWSANQIIFIKHLHIATGLVISGKFTAGKEAKNKDDASADQKPKYNCSPEERNRVKADIEAYTK